MVGLEAESEPDERPGLSDTDMPEELGLVRDRQEARIFRSGMFFLADEPSIPAQPMSRLDRMGENGPQKEQPGVFSE